ncbi:energy-coupling factor transporter transmembrane component T family protein [Aquipuribacter hungaricus]|uniref:Energy-coupling factor transporter transmembrane component T family protein n=1 Tax=Aquipuribacter hungaricus TaxID=545624 RepID=A0ABV7WCQ8_9MICO
MSLPTDVLSGTAGVDTGALLARTNPSAKLAVALVLSLALVLTTDPVTAGVALALVVAALPWSGLGARALWRRGWVLVVAAVPTGVFTAVLGVDSGRVLLPLGPLDVTSGSLAAGVALVLRILAIGLPGVVLLATTDPTDLADSLAQDLRLPHRFVLSALAAMRLFGVLAEEWTALGQARRARGLGEEGLVGRARAAGAQVFALLVLAVRRATVLATAMEARGFGAARTRTWARPSRVRPADVAVVLGGVAVAAVATAAGVAAGTWELVLS